MKYNIQINQAALSKTNLDIIDGAILDYLYVYCNSRNEKIDEQRIKDKDGDWTWINYQTLLNDMPLLKIKSPGALTPRIKRIEAAGYIETFRKGNQKLFIRMSGKVDELFIKMNSSVHENEQLPSKSCSRRRTNYSTNNIDYNTIDNNMSAEPTFSLKEEIEKLLTDKRRHIQIIGLWIQEMGLKPENQDQIQSIIHRNSRPAMLLKGYKNEDIQETIKILKRTEYLQGHFGIETITKFIDEVVANRKKQGPKIIRWEEIKSPDGTIKMRAIYK